MIWRLPKTKLEYEIVDHRYDPSKQKLILIISGYSHCTYSVTYDLNTFLNVTEDDYSIMLVSGVFECEPVNDNWLGVIGNTLK